MKVEAKKERARFTVPEALEIGPGKEPERLPEIPIPREKIRAIVEQLDFYVTRYEEAIGASEQCIQFTLVIDTLSQVKTTAWVPMSRLCANAYTELGKVYLGDIETWQASIPDCPDIEPYVQQYKDRLGLVGQAIGTLPSKVLPGDKDAIIGMLSQCSTEMRQESQEIAGKLLGRIRTLVQELDKLLPKPKPSRDE